MTQAALFLVGLGVATFWWLSGRLAAPHRAKVGLPPPELKAESIELVHRNGVVVRGWLAIPATPRAGVLLLHGVTENRRQMLKRAEFLFAAGYSVLLIDMRGHGESSGEHITFGLLESKDVHLALAHLRARLPDLPIGAVGNSMGGAATLLGSGPAEIDALVLEAVYPDIRGAVSNRLANRLGPTGRLLTPLFLAQLRFRLGVDPAHLRPVDAISRLEAPLLLMAGSADLHTTLGETRELFAAAQEPKEQWVVEGAGHEDLHGYAPEAYEQRVLAFFDRYLARPYRDAG